MHSDVVFGFHSVEAEEGVHLAFKRWVVQNEVAIVESRQYRYMYLKFRSQTVGRHLVLLHIEWLNMFVHQEMKSSNITSKKYEWYIINQMN